MIPFKSLKPGDKLIADEVFTCLREGEIVTVELNGEELGFRCAGPDEGENAGADHGKPASAKRLEWHNFEGQLDDDENVVGFERVPAGYLSLIERSMAFLREVDGRSSGKLVGTSPLALAALNLRLELRAIGALPQVEEAPLTEAEQAASDRYDYDEQRGRDRARDREQG